MALHATILALFLQRAIPTPAPAPPASIAIIGITSDRPAAANPPPPTLPAEIAKTFKPKAELAISAESESDAPAGVSTACSTLAMVLDRLLQDPGAIGALRAAPPETRSISQAVMMWNEAWIPAAASGATPLWRVRLNIEQTLTEVPDGCLDEQLIGPRLLPVPDAQEGSTTLVVLGSGNWAWRQMITSPEALAAQGAVFSLEGPQSQH